MAVARRAVPTHRVGKPFTGRDGAVFHHGQEVEAASWPNVGALERQRHLVPIAPASPAGGPAKSGERETVTHGKPTDQG